MHRLLSGSMLALLVALGASSPVAAGDPPAARIDPNFAPLGGVAPGAIPAFPSLVPGNPAAYPQPRPVPPSVDSDVYGRCWQQVPVYRPPGNYGSGYFGKRPRGWTNGNNPNRDPYVFD